MLLFYTAHISLLVASLKLSSIVRTGLIFQLPISLSILQLYHLCPVKPFKLYLGNFRMGTSSWQLNQDRSYLKEKSNNSLLDVQCNLVQIQLLNSQSITRDPVSAIMGSILIPLGVGRLWVVAVVVRIYPFVPRIQHPVIVFVTWVEPFTRSCTPWDSTMSIPDLIGTSSFTSWATTSRKVSKSCNPLSSSFFSLLVLAWISLWVGVWCSRIGSVPNLEQRGEVGRPPSFVVHGCYLSSVTNGPTSTDDWVRTKKEEQKRKKEREREILLREGAEIIESKPSILALLWNEWKDLVLGIQKRSERKKNRNFMKECKSYRESETTFPQFVRTWEARDVTQSQRETHTERDKRPSNLENESILQQQPVNANVAGKKEPSREGTKGWLEKEDEPRGPLACQILIFLFVFQCLEQGH